MQEADLGPHACGYDHKVTLQLGAVVQHHGGDQPLAVPAGVRSFGGEEEAAAVGFKALLVLSGGATVQLKGQDSVRHLYHRGFDSPLHQRVGRVHSHQAGTDDHSV